MKNNTTNLSLMAVILLKFAVFSVIAGIPGTDVPRMEKSGNITYIDIGIYQPNVEDCYGTLVPDKGMEHDWIKIYPNPNPGQFTLELNLYHPGKSLVIHIYDIAGKVVFESVETTEGNLFRKELDVSYFQKGVYFIRITGKDKIGVKQIIIN